MVSSPQDLPFSRRDQAPAASHALTPIGRPLEPANSGLTSGLQESGTGYRELERTCLSGIPASGEQEEHSVVALELGLYLPIRHLNAQGLAAGRIEFIDENGGGPGVRLRKSGKEKPGK